jgi:hypothetical protein
MVRPFPPPWSVEELEARFIVKDGVGQKLCGRRASTATAPALALRWRYRFMMGNSASYPWTRPPNKSTSRSSMQAADFLRGAARLT